MLAAWLQTGTRSRLSAHKALVKRARSGRVSGVGLHPRDSGGPARLKISEEALMIGHGMFGALRLERAQVLAQETDEDVAGGRTQ